MFRKCLLILVLAALPVAAFAGPVARQYGGGSTMYWELSTTNYESAMLSWSCGAENGALGFPGGKSTVSLDVRELGTDVPDGACSWELRLKPVVPKDVAEKLAAARAAGDDKAARRILKEAGIDPESLVGSGAFSVERGAFVTTEGTETGNPNQSRTSGGMAANAVAERPSGPIAVNDQVIPDDLIVQGSECVGFDCVNGETFNFDTIRLKENNLRIHFDDTSTIAGYPVNDWRIIANDSASGGASKFSVEDSTGGKTPLTIRAGASTNSIFVDSTGRVGFRTSAPVLDLHINTSNTPAIRLEQNNSGGFTAQTWDLGGNEANFFIRDVTEGSTLPFRLRPGAPTSSVDISASGAVGIAGASPTNPINTGGYVSKLQLLGSDELGSFFRIYNSNNTWEMGGTWMPNTAKTGGWLFGTNNTGAATLTFGSGGNEGGALTDAKDTGDGLTILTNGDTGIRCNTPASDFVISATTNCSGSQSSINAGSAQFTVSSSRTIKENLEPVAVPDLLERMSKVDVYTYDFKQGPKDRLGLMAEDFHAVFERGSDKVIDGNEVQMALWLAVQQLTAQNKALQERLTALEQK
jgi:hypothetical protein